ncbi:thioredoxin [Idiomarina tyrosinivorans]|uniref:Thioredoxin n=1 Tax=Idiomarina tyrosinivorans TaxID=1445662 RepID=A0A432ZK34_9GAMM|nr:thioredoxin [Idiomarina tyrosinivorans]RUO78190.1 thioredoxin [Idiomarina tyrosinivorans]
MQANNIVDVTTQNFQQVLIEQSRERLVIIDFWADWCEPCKQLMPTLEAIANKYPDDVLLAKLNCDEQQELAMQFGVRSLPTVAFFKDGQPVDSFAGVKSQSDIEAMLEPHLPSPSDDLIQQAQAKLAEQDNDAAYTLAKQAYDVDSTNLAAKKVLIAAAIAMGRLEQAQQLLQSISLADQDADYQQLKARVELAEQAADSPELRALVEQADQQPDDIELQLQVAAKLHEAQRAEEALERLFALLQKDRSNDTVKKSLIDLLQALPDGDPLAATYRRRLYSMMY